MNLFFLISFAAFAAFFAGTLIAVLIWCDLAKHFGKIRRRFAKGFEPLADPERLERAASRLNRTILRFDSPDLMATGRN